MFAVTVAANDTIQKVVQMLTDMSTKAKNAKATADSAHSAELARLVNEINEAKESAEEQKNAMETANVAAEAANANMEKATKAIADAAQIISAKKDDKKALTKQRQAAKAAYTKNAADAEAGFIACGRLIDALDDIQDKTTAGFIQEHMVHVQKKGAVNALLQAVAQLENPEIIYKKDDKFKEIVALIEKLKDELSADLTSMATAEANEQHAYEMAIANADNAIKTRTEEKTENEEKLAQQTNKWGTESENAGIAKGEMDSQNAIKQTAEAAKITEVRDYNVALAAREAEITAIDEAVQILSAGGGIKEVKHQDIVPAVALLQMKRYDSSNSDKALTYLRNKAVAIHSKVLLMLTEVAMTDPFAKVRGLIENLIKKLEEEANAAATHHQSCKKDMDKNKEDLENVSAAIDELENSIATNDAIVEKKTAAIKKNTASIAEIDASITKGTDLHSANENTLSAMIQEGEAALKALRTAIKVLQDGNTAAAAGGPKYSEKERVGGLETVIEVLQHIEGKQNASNVANETEKDDNDTNWTNRKQKLDAAKVKAQRAKSNAEKEKEKAKENLSDDKQALLSSQTEQDLLLKTKRGNEQRCVAKGASHEENARKREEEIQSLRDALQILEASS